MRTITWGLLLFLTGAVLSCSSPEREGLLVEQPVEYEPAESFLQLRAGNYWVYESYSINLETGEETPLFKRDSLYVLKDTLIGRLAYSILEGSHLGQPYRSILRCSGPDVMDADGRLLFSTAAIGDTAQLPASLLPAGVESGNYCVLQADSVAVPYGTFSAIEYQRLYHLSAPDDGKAGQPARRQSDFYARGIGLIKYTSFFPGQPMDIEMRLARCKVR